MTENELLRDCLERLNASGVAYYLTGSMASNFWGLPRSTHDLDFVVQIRSEDVPRVVAAFQKDFFIQESAVRAALAPPYQFNALDQRSSLKVDFWVLTDEPFPQQMFARRRQETLFGTPAWIASAEDVFLHKLHWDALAPSERQLRDAAGIWAVQGQQLDLAYMETWAKTLNVDEVFQRIKRGEIRPKST